MLTEGGLEMRQVNEEVGLLDAHEATFLVQSGPGHQAVNMRMKAQLLIPGVENGGEAADSGLKALGSAELLRQSE